MPWARNLPAFAEGLCSLWLVFNASCFKAVYSSALSFSSCLHRALRPARGDTWIIPEVSPVLAHSCAHEQSDRFSGICQLFKAPYGTSVFPFHLLVNLLISLSGRAMSMCTAVSKHRTDLLNLCLWSFWPVSCEQCSAYTAKWRQAREWSASGCYQAGQKALFADKEFGGSSKTIVYPPGARCSFAQLL